MEYTAESQEKIVLMLQPFISEIQEAVEQDDPSAESKKAFVEKELEKTMVLAQLYIRNKGFGEGSSINL